MKKTKQLATFILIVAIIVLSWGCLSLFQHLRHGPDYNCRHMTADCQYFFNGIGIETKIAHGYNYDENGDITSKHRWLILCLPWGDVEFNPVTLYFQKVSDHYEVVEIDLMGDI